MRARVFGTSHHRSTSRSVRRDAETLRGRGWDAAVRSSVYPPVTVLTFTISFAILTSLGELLRRARCRQSFTTVLRAAASGETPGRRGGGVGGLLPSPQCLLFQGRCGSKFGLSTRLRINIHDLFCDSHSTRQTTKACASLRHESPPYYEPQRPARRRDTAGRGW